MKVASKELADENAEGRALCDRMLGELCSTEDSPRAVKLIREMAARSDATATGFLFRLAHRAI